MATLEQRSVIEEATSIVVSLLDCSHDAALAVLVARADRDSRNLRDTASAIVAHARRDAESAMVS